MPFSSLYFVKPCASLTLFYSLCPFLIVSCSSPAEHSGFTSISALLFCVEEDAVVCVCVGVVYLHCDASHLSLLLRLTAFFPPSVLTASLCTRVRAIDVCASAFSFLFCDSHKPALERSFLVSRFSVPFAFWHVCIYFASLAPCGSLANSRTAYSPLPRCVRKL